MACAAPAVGEIWLVGEQERSELALVLADVWEHGDDEGLPGRYVSAVLLGRERWWQTSLEMRLLAAESTLGEELLVEWRSQGPVPAASFRLRVGRLSGPGHSLVARALAGDWEEGRFGAPLQSASDPRLAGIRSAEKRLRRLLASACAQARAGACE